MVSTCTTCYGYGLWAIGTPEPMGPMDAEDGMPTLPCSECGANANDYDFENITVQKPENISENELSSMMEDINYLRNMIKILTEK